MSVTYDCADLDVRESAIAAAARTVQSGQLVVLPTDTVYGIGADAFDARAVADLIAAKGRGRDMPVPVLISPARAVTIAAEEMSTGTGMSRVSCRQKASDSWTPTGPAR